MRNIRINNNWRCIMNKNGLFEELYSNLREEFGKDFVDKIELLIEKNKFNKKNFLKIIGENFHE